MRTFRRLAALWSIALCLTVSGCFPWYDYNSSHNYGSKRHENPQDTSRAYQTKQQYAKVSHRIARLEMNQFLSDQVQALNGVNSAIVMMGDKVAYVGITIDGTATGTKSGNSRLETNNYGLVKGLYSPITPFNDGADPNDLITGSNGADTVMHHEHLSHMFKQKIAERIRSLDPTVQDVYISANQVFVNELNRLAQESWHGRSLEPYREHFIAMVEKLFGTDPTIPNQAEGNGKE